MFNLVQSSHLNGLKKKSNILERVLRKYGFEVHKNQEIKKFEI